MWGVAMCVRTDVGTFANHLKLQFHSDICVFAEIFFKKSASESRRPTSSNSALPAIRRCRSDSATSARTPCTVTLVVVLEDFIFLKKCEAPIPGPTTVHCATMHPSSGFRRSRSLHWYFCETRLHSDTGGGSPRILFFEK